MKRSLTGLVADLVSHGLTPFERTIESTTETTSPALKTTAANKQKNYKLTRVLDVRPVNETIFIFFCI